MDVSLFKQLLNDDLITGDELEKVQAFEETHKVSVHWDLKIVLYLGIILLTSGIGILVYQNLDTIGHQAIIAFIGLCCAGCFYYCVKKGKGFSHQKVESPSIWFDYVLLLGCLLLLTFIGYIQFQYQFFGTHWGLATLVPMVLLFIAAYRFDHLGVLSLAITNLATWAGISITPMGMLRENDYTNNRLIITGLVLGMGLMAFAWLSEKKDLKKHFAFTYKNFGANMMFVAAVAGMFRGDNYPVYFLVLAAISAFMYREAMKENSYYFLVITLLYFYVGVSYVAITIFSSNRNIGALYLDLFYFIVSGIALINILIHFNKKLKSHDSLS